jgi:integrase
MPKKYQNGKLEVRNDVKRPYYFVRVSVPVIDGLSGQRKMIREKRPLGFLDETTQKQAMKARTELLETVNQSRLLIQSQIRFNDLAKRFVKVRLPQFSASTRAKYQCHIDAHLLPAFGAMKLSEIDKPALEEFFTSKAETLAWWTRVDLRGILSAIFSAAKEWRLWDGDKPTLGVRIGKKQLKREKRLLKVEELQAILAALPDHLRFLVLILFGLGLRISEALALKWKDIDFGEAVIDLQRRWYRGDLSHDGEMKNETSTGPLRLSETLLDEFRRRYPGPAARDRFIFLGPDGVNPPDDRDLLRYEFRPVLKRLGLYYEGFGWHAFRRQNITWKQQLGGATPLEAQKAARHATLDMTYLYTLTDPERETLQQQRMFEALLGTGKAGDKIQ